MVAEQQQHQRVETREVICTHCDRPIDIPGYMISQADSNAIKGQIGGPGIGTVDPANQLPP